MNYHINNFVGIDPIKVCGDDYTDNKGIGDKLVSITQRAGSSSFQHSMNTVQARELAAALIACCEELEAV